jgi:hypothetical protein
MFNAGFKKKILPVRVNLKMPDFIAAQLPAQVSENQPQNIWTARKR